ncbi:MAG TPA: hypothetical protein VMV95_02705 [Bacillota bacterium]|nr:hypothetical protein [Bacillota bacterium]
MKSKEEFNLSEKKQKFHLEPYFYCETDIKEFIRRLKEEIDKKFEEMKATFYETDSSEIAMTRFNCSKWINIIDEIDTLAGEDLK